MLPVFVYWGFLQLTGKTVFPRWMAWGHVFVIFAVLKALSLQMPEGAFRLGFTNGLMSESMAVWFMGMLLWICIQGNARKGREQHDDCDIRGV